MDSARLNDLGINNNDMINLGISNLSTEDQTLMGAFFSNMKNPAPAKPMMTQQQLLNQYFHNIQNEKIRMETQKIKQMYATDLSLKTRLAQNDPQLASALESGNNQEIEKIISERMKTMFE